MLPEMSFAKSFGSCPGTIRATPPGLHIFIEHIVHHLFHFGIQVILTQKLAVIVSGDGKNGCNFRMPGGISQCHSSPTAPAAKVNPAGSILNF
jgi:hypothetical protein